MAKTETIIVRIDPDAKRRIEAAAKQRGQSVTTFLLEAAEKAARKVESMPVARPTGRGACPTWFLATCREASRGGSWGYEVAGRKLAAALSAEQPWDLDEGEWTTQMERLAELVLPTDPDRPNMFATHLRDDTAVLAWFDEHFPRCMKLVPMRRRSQFVEGVYQAADNEEVEWPLT
jgi:Protein of unknown function (DUF1778)